MVKPRRFRNFRSLACPRCGYGLVELPRSLEYLCPECGLNSPRASCPPDWSVEIGADIRIRAYLVTLIAAFLPTLISDAVLRPREIARPARVVLIPIFLAALFHALNAVLSPSPWWPYATTGDYLVMESPADVILLLCVAAAMVINLWLAILVCRMDPRGNRPVVALRLWCYAFPHTIMVATAWVLIRTANIEHYLTRGLDPYEIYRGLLMPLGSPVSLVIALLLVSVVWWGCMTAAVSNQKYA